MLQSGHEGLPQSGTRAFPIPSGAARVERSEAAGFLPCLAPSLDTGESQEIPGGQSSSRHLATHTV